MRRAAAALVVTGALVSVATGGVFVGSARAGGKPAPGAAGSPSFDFTRGIGMVEGTKDTVWLMIADSTLAPGDSLTILSDEPHPDPDTYVTLISAAVAERLPAEPASGTGQKMHPEEGDVFYRLVPPRGALDCCIFGYAVRAPRSAFRIMSGRAEADLDGDGTFERFQSCASMEGLHPTVWSGEPLRGPRRWSRYYYLGYDLEPNCPDLDSLPTN